MNYKETIKLPRTSFSMKGGLIKREPELLERWSEMDIEGRITAARKDSESFVLHDGPPYANGHVHLGTALNKILKDFIVKSHTMMGYYSPYVPGWDCHGMPIEHKVMTDAGEERASLSLMEIRNRCRDYAAGFVDVQREEFKRLGVFGRWDNPYLTMKKTYEAGIVKAFGKLVEDGYIYQGLRPIHWCTSCTTALADAEVEYADHSSPSVYVAFRQVDPDRWLAAGVPGDVEVVIWTTTPWTLPANMAVALNPGENYVIVDTADRHFLVAERRAQAFIEASEIDGSVRPDPVFRGRELENLVLEHPVNPEKTSLVILADHVTMDDGTGCVHTAPGHGSDDFMVCQNYGIETFCPVGPEGKFTEEGGKYRGLHVFKANSVIVEDLTESGRMIASSSIKHSYPHCWRCKKPLIFRATEQFFLSLSHRDLKKRVLEMVDEVNWYPDWGYDRMKNMMSVRPDWCLSRQRSWGVALPVFTCPDCGEAVLDSKLIAKVAEKVLEDSADVWFTMSPDEIFALDGRKARCPHCGGTSLKRVDDILDVWFDSSLSHFNVLTEEYGLSRPASVYLEATDQHRGWFGVSLVTSNALGLSRPVDNIITHGLIQDKKGKKMSKSLGNVISPLKVISANGADILRLWFAGIDYTSDFRADLGQLADSREAYRKIRNTIRFMLGNLEDATGKMPDPETLTGLDRYIWLRFRKLMAFCIDEYRKFQFHRVYRELRNFMVIELSGLYLDARKDRLYCDDPHSPERAATVELLGWLTVELSRLLAPVIPFTAEDIWDHIPDSLKHSESVHLELFTLDSSLSAEEEAELSSWSEYLDVRKNVLKRLEEQRTQGTIGGGLDAHVYLTLPEEMVQSALGESWADFLIVSRVLVGTGETIEIEVVKAEGGKCQRCWKIIPEVGTHPFADDVCPRCGKVLETIEN
ncbi:isoleucine--tRNA ligase [Candidatus Fermentibacteria bacterium]|nr:MAG: isoleucine--tRNA ligase [Candidatus Fermentibacteria bacterium]